MLLKEVGFEKADLVSETGFNSSPKTKGVLFFGAKSLVSRGATEPQKDIHLAVEADPPQEITIAQKISGTED